MRDEGRWGEGRKRAGAKGRKERENREEGKQEAENGQIIDKPMKEGKEEE